MGQSSSTGKSNTSGGSSSSSSSNTKSTTNKTTSSSSIPTQSKKNKNQTTSVKNKEEDPAPESAPKKKESRSKIKRDSSAKEDGFSQKKLEKLYENADPNEDYIGPDGVAAFLNDINVDPEDVVALIIAWHLQAAEMGYFTREEFVEGFKGLGCDSIEKIVAKLPALRNELNDPTKLKEIYRYGFHFAKEDADKKVIPLDMAVAMMKLILGNKPHVENYCTFLLEQDSYKSVNLDQWMSFLEFSRTISPDLTDYDENGAWPVLIDMFVEWAREKGLAPKPEQKDE